MVAPARDRTDRHGNPYHLVTRRELEALPTFRSRGADKARAACPFHGGDNPQALEIDFAAGWAHCYTQGCRARIVDDLEPRRHRRKPNTFHHKPPTPTAPQHETKQDIPHAQGTLAAAFDRARAALPDSPAVAYLEGRGIALELAQRYGLGWATSGELRNRLVFPLTNPAGEITSATGRAITAGTEPKYWNLAETRTDKTTGKRVPTGYAKGWFHAQAIAEARTTGAPLFLAEGVFDCLGLLAGGITTAAAINGKKDPRVWEWLAAWVSGVPRVVLCPDEDADGGGRAAFDRLARELVFTVPAIVAPPGYLGDCKDLGDYWQRHRTLPPALAALATPPESPQNRATCPETGDSPANAQSPADERTAPLSAQPAGSDLAAPVDILEAYTLKLPMTDARIAFRAARDRDCLHAPAALGMGLPLDMATEAAAYAAWYFWHSPDALLATRIELEALPDSDPVRAVQLAGLLEAYDRRRYRRGIRRCYACGGELLSSGKCAGCHPAPHVPRWRQPIYRTDGPLMEAKHPHDNP